MALDESGAFCHFCSEVAGEDYNTNCLPGESIWQDSSDTVWMSCVSCCTLVHLYCYLAQTNCIFQTDVFMDHYPTLFVCPNQNCRKMLIDKYGIDEIKKWKTPCVHVD